jgi:hypothetical protein
LAAFFFLAAIIALAMKAEPAARLAEAPAE